jgi:aspartyl-tRNA(Asn)/glutamyl-tRNA(Gln) amidotransferase subunit A
MKEFLKLSLVEMCDAVLNRRLSPVELMEATLERIHEVNPQLNAIVIMQDEEVLMAQAREAERRVMRGEGRPLEGIPLGVKDLEDVEGMVTTCGSLVFRDQVADRDSIQVARLKAAGAIVVGKTNTPEFGYTAITKNILHGVTRSPWELSRTPGGSSGGSSAALASCMLPLVTASDGGGSIRIPASFVGAFGLKPSFGRIPKGPMDRWVYGDFSVYGPLTRTVEDAAYFMDQVVGPSPWDPKSLPHPGFSYLEKVRQPPPRGLRIAYSPDLGIAAVQSDVAEAVEEGVRVLEAMGNTVEQIKGGPPMMNMEWALLSGFELAARLHQQIRERPEDFGRSFLEGLKQAWSVDPQWWGEAAQKRAELCQWFTEVLLNHDILVTPTVPYDPPPAKGPFPEETEGKRHPHAGVATFTIPLNLSWHPAATVRAGLSRAGLPVGMQIIGPRHRDEMVLHVARAYELERPWHPNWPTDW